ncbi:MAG: ribose-phosphate diphosphokinase [Nanoarchaeota archaeon]|nr:ribose-phosphate diphosphokinase [Nanoarchaeota archaeon]
MIVIGCSHGKHVAKAIARKAKCAYGEITAERFPDNEQHLTIRGSVDKRRVILVQSFHDNPDGCLIEVLLAAWQAKQMGATSVSLMAPFFAYMRQDKSFTIGEVNSIHALGPLISHSFDQLYILDPHLHREKTLGHIFSIPSHRLTANPLIANAIKSLKNPLIVGPDWESYKWAQRTADMIGAEATILEKDRTDARNVKVHFKKKVEIKGRHCILIDDMISTGHTLLETIKKLKKLEAKKITCYAVHGLFVEGALEKLKKTGASVITTNSIPNPTGKLDVSGLFAEKLKQ